MLLDTFYLCVKTNPNLFGFECSKFNTYDEADDFYEKYKKDDVLMSTIIPVNKFMPFHILTLEKKLSKMVINVKILHK